MCSLCSNELGVVPFLFPFTIWDLPQKEDLHPSISTSQSKPPWPLSIKFSFTETKRPKKWPVCKLSPGQACAKCLFYHMNHLIMESHPKQDFSQRRGCGGVGGSACTRASTRVWEHQKPRSPDTLSLMCVCPSPFAEWPSKTTAPETSVTRRPTLLGRTPSCHLFVWLAGNNTGVNVLLPRCQLCSKLFAPEWEARLSWS